MRIVLDTNVLIGALITRGTPPDHLCHAWYRRQFDLVTSPAQLQEMARVISRPRMQKYINPTEAEDLIENLNTRALVVKNLPIISLSSDPADNLILATAIAGEADLIVTGDIKHLLVLGQAEGIPIVSPREALERIKNE